MAKELTNAGTAYSDAVTCDTLIKNGMDLGGGPSRECKMGLPSSHPNVLFVHVLAVKDPNYNGNKKSAKTLKPKSSPRADIVVTPAICAALK